MLRILPDYPLLPCDSVLIRGRTVPTMSVALPGITRLEGQCEMQLYFFRSLFNKGTLGCRANGRSYENAIVVIPYNVRVVGGCDIDGSSVAERFGSKRNSDHVNDGTS